MSAGTHTFTVRLTVVGAELDGETPLAESNRREFAARLMRAVYRQWYNSSLCLTGEKLTVSVDGRDKTPKEVWCGQPPKDGDAYAEDEV